MVQKLSYNEIREINQNFKNMDQESDGFITYNDLKVALLNIGKNYHLLLK